MPNIIPVSLTSLIGREQEIEALCQLLRSSEVRLVTITGPGGVGKTSLALQVAHDVQDTFVDGVFFISLAAISDPTLIIPTIAHTLGVIESPNRLLLDSLKEFLRERQALLVLEAEFTVPPWTPLFATAAAVVTDGGGVLCHSAVVAREYRSPRWSAQVMQLRHSKMGNCSKWMEMPVPCAWSLKKLRRNPPWLDELQSFN